MSAERTIADFLHIAQEDLDAARHLLERGNRNAAYMAEQAAEKVIRAVLTSEGVHAGVGHDLRAMVQRIPVENPVRDRLARLAPLARFATAYRYPTGTRIPPSPDAATLDEHLNAVGRALADVAAGFGVDLADSAAAARRAGPLR